MFVVGNILGQDDTSTGFSTCPIEIHLLWIWTRGLCHEDLLIGEVFRKRKFIWDRMLARKSAKAWPFTANNYYII